MNIEHNFEDIDKKVKIKREGVFRYMRWCKRCGQLKEVCSRNSKVCPDCYRNPHKAIISKKVKVLGKKLIENDKKKVKTCQKRGKINKKRVR